MRVGFGLPVAGSWATPQLLAEVAVEAERFGYDSLWTLEPAAARDRALEVLHNLAPVGLG